jgi:hypothetical protein
MKFVANTPMVEYAGKIENYYWIQMNKRVYTVNTYSAVCDLLGVLIKVELVKGAIFRVK